MQKGRRYRYLGYQVTVLTLQMETCQCNTIVWFFLSIQVLFHEMRAIQKACHELEVGYQPAITFIVAVKRHHGRFNILSREDGVNYSFSFDFLFLNFLQKQSKTKKFQV